MELAEDHVLEVEDATTGNYGVTSYTVRVSVPQGIATSINEKGQLPDITSVDEVARDGVTLGQMNAKPLQKIEEITLYSISQEERLKAQEARIQKLESLLAKSHNE